MDVIPAKAGIQVVNFFLNDMFKAWTPAFAGVTNYRPGSKRKWDERGVVPQEVVLKILCCVRDRSAWPQRELSPVCQLASNPPSNREFCVGQIHFQIGAWRRDCRFLWVQSRWRYPEILLWPILFS